MKTKKDIEKIIIENMEDGVWCKSECKKALKYLEQFKDDDTIDIIAKNIPDEWALEWAFEIGDREIMKKSIHTEEYALEWAYWIGDKDYMKQFICSEEFAFYWAVDIGDIEYMSQFIKSKYWKDRWKNLLRRERRVEK